jgi:crotonobetainyl-CoA:carnitine CoA-transferase CaiB-like acyl-CoA transferase
MDANIDRASAAQPLAGIRVLDLTRHLPGPWCTMTLGDLGAEVIKIERPRHGDTVRTAQPRYVTERGSESVYFCNVNRNKTSLELDFKSEADRARLIELARDADVLVENFRAGTADRLGIGYDALRAHNPRLVYCALTGYGQTGALSEMPGHDLSLAGLTGMLQPDASQPPHMPIALMGDYAAASAALTGILAGVVAARTRGLGSYVDVAMLDALSAWTGVQMTSAFAAALGGVSPKLEGWGGNPRYNIYCARDGRYVTVALLEKVLWDRFCRVFGRPDLVNDAETEADRLTGHGERFADYRAFIADTVAGADRAEWIERSRTHELPVCPIYTLDEWFHSPEARERGLFTSMPHPGLGCTIPQMGFPFRMRMADGGDAFALRHPPPALGDQEGATRGPEAKQ